MPNGRLLSRQILEHPGAVVVIPKTKEGQFILVRQFRFAAGNWLWEFPAGGIEKGESIRRAAARELSEEICLAPRRLKELLRFYPTPRISGEIMYLYLAEGLYVKQGKCDEDEEFTVKAFSLSEIGRMIRRGRIVDGKTMLGYACLKYGLKRA